MASKRCDLSKVSIDEVGFSSKTLQSLKESKLRTMGALTFMSKEDLVEIYHINKDSIQEIESKLNEYGSRLRTNAEKIMDNFYEDCMFGTDGPLWNNPRQKDKNKAPKITREDIVDLYKERYVNNLASMKLSTSGIMMGF